MGKRIKMALLDFGYQTFVTSGDTIAPTGSNQFRIICIQCSVEETGVAWSIEDATESRSVRLTGTDSSSRKGNGIVGVEMDSYVGSSPIGMVGSIAHILDSNLAFNCNINWSAGTCGIVWYQVVAT